MPDTGHSVVNIGIIQYIDGVAVDLLSLADASVLLGVSAERVRQLVVAGDLPGVRFGNAWAVPKASIVARRQASNRRGRPLSPHRAWELIIAGDVDLSNLSRYRNRGEVHRYEISRADIAFLAGGDDRAIVSGVAAAVELGGELQEDIDGADLYMAASRHRQLLSRVAAVADPIGPVIIRAVPDSAWNIVDDAVESSSGDNFRVAPGAAVALDLMDSGDPRHWIAAQNLFESRD